jgi:hypothetical protein
MMDRPWQIGWLGAIGIALAVVSPAWSQFNTAPFTREAVDRTFAPVPVNPFQLLALEGVRNELQLSGDQRAHLQALGRQLLQNRRVPASGLGREGVLESFLAAMPELTEAEQQSVDQALKGMFSEAQTGRFQQLMIQYQGLDALSSPTMIKQLELSPAQQAELARFRRESFATQVRDIQRALLVTGNPSANRNAMRARLQQINQEAESRLRGVLTPDQTKKFNELRGAPFEFVYAAPK